MAVLICNAVMQGMRCANVVPWWGSCPLASDGVDGDGNGSLSGAVEMRVRISRG